LYRCNVSRKQKVIANTESYMTQAGEKIDNKIIPVAHSYLYYQTES
jgi:hypothetical protein